MIIGVPNELSDGETRVALVPEQVTQLREMGAQCRVEGGLGQGAGWPDEAYRKAGAELVSDRETLFGASDLLLRLHPSSDEEIGWLKAGTLHVSLLDPFRQSDRLKAMAEQGLTGVSLQMIPRISRAQAMDVLSSQASLAGYVAVIMAAARLPRIFPLMMTAAGTLQPARVLVLGAGVAGLQAIATAHRLGARVQAYDTRPAVEEQVRSLGARFLKLDLGETGQTSQGYAKALTPDQLQRQREQLQRACTASDVIITAAQVFGRQAPILLTREMLQSLKPGTVVVDLAVDNGGNVAGDAPNEVPDTGPVVYWGEPHPARRVPAHASQVYSANVTAWIRAFWSKENSRMALDLEDEILKACVLTHDGKVLWPSTTQASA